MKQFKLREYSDPSADLVLVNVDQNTFLTESWIKRSVCADQPSAELTACISSCLGVIWPFKHQTIPLNLMSSLINFD